ncbi:MAG: hypothetical protein ACI8QC_002194 [Planctomycetota bacterium]|jgi:hypothetical protein
MGLAAEGRTPLWLMHQPPRSRELADTPIAATRMPGGVALHVRQELGLVIGHDYLSACSRSTLPDQTARSVLADLVLLYGEIDSTPSAGRAQEFSFAMSFSTPFSRAWSATKRLGRPSSFSSSLRRFNSGSFIPPYWLCQRQ